MKGVSAKSQKLDEQGLNLLRVYVDACGGVREAAIASGVCKTVLYKLMKVGHAHPNTVKMLRPLIYSKHIADLVCDEFNITEEELFDKRPDRETAQAKKVAIYLLRRHAKIKRVDIGAMFGYKEVRIVNRVCDEIANMIFNKEYSMHIYVKRIEDKISV